MKKEIERKFLLKDIPIHNSLSEIQHIIQYYYFSDNVWKRIRKIESNMYGNMYLHTIKTFKDGILFEEEEYFSYEQFKSLLDDINDGKYKTTFISKNRYIFLTGIDADFEGEIKNIKWEVDVFNFSLIIAEIEIPDFNFQIEIPSFIKDKLIYEVTGIQEFSNRIHSQPLMEVLFFNTNF